jgi:hypothetical protein
MAPAPAPDDVADHDDIAVFLNACSKLLHENVTVLESASSRVSELVSANAKPDPGLVVALQGFDRLKQEFEALGHALAGYSEHFRGELDPEERRRYLHEAVERMGLAELRSRLLDHIGTVLYPPAPLPPDAPLEEIEVDIEF